MGSNPPAGTNLFLLKGLIALLVLKFFYFLIKMVVLVFAMKFITDVLKTFITERYRQGKEVEEKTEFDDRFRFRR